MPEPLTEEQLQHHGRWAIRLADGPCNGCRIASKAMASLIAEVERLKAERVAIAAECLSIARQPIGHDAGAIMTKVLSLFPKEAL